MTDYRTASEQRIREAAWSANVERSEKHLTFTFGSSEVSFFLVAGDILGIDVTDEDKGGSAILPAAVLRRWLNEER